MLTLERYTDYLIGVQHKLQELDEPKLQDIDSNMALEFDEHFQFQNWQSQAHALAIIDTPTAQRIYASLGEVLSSTNGGWAKGVSTAEKFTITKLMSELSQQIRKRNGLSTQEPS